MVFVVKERTKELGIRKALGATPKSVIQMILQESVFITTISGYIGLFFGIIVLENIGLKLEEYFIKNPYIDLGTSIAATIILILFGEPKVLKILTLSLVLSCWGVNIILK